MSKKENQPPECCPYCGKILVDHGTDDIVAKESYSLITDEVVCEECAKSIREKHEQNQEDHLEVIPPHDRDRGGYYE